MYATQARFVRDPQLSVGALFVRPELGRTVDVGRVAVRSTRSKQRTHAGGTVPTRFDIRFAKKRKNAGTD
jgi:hypothetical protein